MRFVVALRGLIMVAVANVLLAGTAARAEDPDVPLRWLGTWQADQSKDCKELRCSARSVQGNQWEAVFTGVCSQAFSFQVKMQGSRQGDRVVFSGETDLGEQNGGVFRWTGTIAEGKFAGIYRSAAGAKQGTFEMQPETATKPEKP